jgi:pSer/pThr/pTyr-binding forkhead associated (FHA) protein
MAGQTVALAEGTHTIGRDPGASLWIDSSLVSRRHARIVVLDGHVTIEDLGSRNGTLLNGDRLTAASSLNDGDEIELGSVPVSVRISSGVTRTMPADDLQ